jgi:FtsZ-interacting cell division protein ZipA
MNTMEIIVLVVAIIAVAGAAWAFLQREKTRKLRHQVGPEYERMIDQEKNPRRAEALLEERRRRVENYPIRSLTKEERDTYAAKWRAAQEHFVDDPRDAIAQADSLVTDAMRTRGYPMTDFESRADDLSVDYPAVVENYRIAHDIATRDAQGSASTEELRKAMQHYRTLFEHVLDTHVLQHH